MEIAVISGKGGTGKSSISAALATLSEKVVLVDCDVDAANLYILFNPSHEEEQIYIGGQKAIIDYAKCTNCGICVNYCRFDAISIVNNIVTISETSCDGCKLCPRICPANAITMVDHNKSRIYSGTFRNGKMIYGRLAPGEENSGKMVNIIREKAKEIAKKNNFETIILDGPPGIGCPVLSTIIGVDRLAIVTEPTISGIHDLKRLMEVIAKTDLKAFVIINKYDLNYDMSIKIEEYCKSINVPIAGRIMFDHQVVEAMINCKSMIEYAPNSNFSNVIESAYKVISN